jgi:peptidoglycan/LPS O-acetylase OafA/YrhL
MLLFRWSRAALAALAIPVIAIATHTSAQDFASTTMVAFYACFSILGIFIAAYRFQIILFLSSNRWLRAVLLAICMYFVWFRSESVTASGYLQEGLLSGVFIMLCISTPWAWQLLRSPPLSYLGRISSSLYLVHMICILVLFCIIPDANPLATAGLVIITSIAAADLLNRLVEVPANRLGARSPALGLRPTRESQRQFRL